MDQAASAQVQEPLLVADAAGGKSDEEETQVPEQDPLTVESLDYDPVHNTIYAYSKRQALQRRLFGYSTRGPINSYTTFLFCCSRT